MAARFKIREWLYVEWEKDREEVPKLNRVRIGEPLTDAEECVLKRRRCNMTQQELADEIECTRQWVIRMENGEAPIDRLLKYWRS